MKVLNIINDYIFCSKYLCLLLKDEYGIQNQTLLSARRSENIPKNGLLSNNIKFNFHGTGCYFEFDEGSIDVEFGPNDRCDGFDLYRLKEFLMSCKKNSSITEEKDLFFENEFQLMIDKGLIINPKWLPGEDLFYLSSQSGITSSIQ